ncbi:glycosyltransferase family 2 protein [Leptolyngbya sp. FACHB-261]|uniref:glycosyltransferase family 2 protein n=1 Tax=Leptolyngbya sp. FACHB-261 TaxID=2692806 RepID=UPI0016870398|nr:glycosyltransferase [Leptolyngbya sp. FACHB-261]MBD2105043.1 glycosyltransferase [Leptolyngbya sp. FACHB-261]
MAEPLVSIVINNYNYGQFLGEAIESALNQTYANVEVVVVDDGSTDHSLAVIKSYGEQIVPVLKLNGGQASAFNAGFAASRGELLCFLDADDVFYPHKVQELIACWQEKLAQHSCTMLYHLLQAVDRCSNCLGYQIPAAPHELPSNLYTYACQYGFLPYAASPTSGITLTRTLAQQIFPLPERGIRTSADDFIVRAASLLGEVHGINRILGEYRIHGNNNWYGNSGPKPESFSLALNEFLNDKLRENNRKPVVAFFDSIYAKDYYIQQQKPAELAKLAFKSLARRFTPSMLKFFWSTLVSATQIYLQTGGLNSAGQHLDQ